MIPVKRILLGTALGLMLHFSPNLANAQALAPASIGAVGALIGSQGQTTGSNSGTTSAFQRQSGAIGVDVSSVFDGAFQTQFGKVTINNAGEAFGRTTGLGASGSSAGVQAGTAAFTQFKAFPSEGFDNFGVNFNQAFLPGR